MREKLRQFMIGRYGTDGLNQFLSIASLVLLLIAIISRVNLFTYLGAALLIFCFAEKEGLLQISFSSVFFFPLLCGTLCGLAAKATLWLVQGTGRIWQVLLPVLSGGTVYLISALLTGCVDEEALSLLPIGSRLSGMLKKIVGRKKRSEK